MQSSWCRVSFAQGRCWTGKCKDGDITKYQELNQMMQHGYEWFTKKSLDSVVPGLKLTSTYLHFCCGTSGRLGIPASVGPGVLGPVPWPATRLPEADTWVPRSEILTRPSQTHIPCIIRVYMCISLSTRFWTTQGIPAVSLLMHTSLWCGSSLHTKTHLS